MNDTIYHYTDCNALVLILKNRQLWVTDTAAMNDSTEKFDFLHSFNARLQNCKFKDESVKCEIEKMTEFTEQGHFGVVCFSKDGDLLTQWISYGDDGSGYSIGFSPESLAKILKAKNRGKNIIVRDLVNTFVNEVTYEEKSKEQLLDTLIEKCESKEPRKAKVDTSFDSLRFDIVRHACSFKNICFKEEHEVRLVKWFRDYLQNDTELYEQGFLNTNYDHRSVLGIPRLYYKHDFEPEWVNEIVLGPKCPATDAEIRRLLLELKYPKDIKIRRSNATYR